MDTRLDLATISGSFSCPLSMQSNHVVFTAGEVDAKTGQSHDDNLLAALIGDLDTAHNGIVLGEDGVVKVGGHGAVAVVQVKHQRLDIPLLHTIRVRQTLQRRLAISDCVGLVLEVAQRIARRLSNLHRGDTEVASSQVRELASDVRLRRPASSVGADQCGGVLGDATGEVVRDEIASLLVDVEAVGDVVAVEGEGFLRYNDGCMNC